MISLDELNEEIKELTKDYKGFKFEYIDTATIVVEPWTRLKCQLSKLWQNTCMPTLYSKGRRVCWNGKFI